MKKVKRQSFPWITNELPVPGKLPQSTRGRANQNLSPGANGRADYKEPITSALSLLWSCQGAGVVVPGRSPPRTLRWGPLGIASWLAAFVSGLAPSLHLPVRGSHRRARVRVGRAAALGPGPSRSLLLRRGLEGATRCSRRARPRRIPPLTGTSPLSPQQTRKVRLGPRRARHPGGRRADTAGSFWCRGDCGLVGTDGKLTYGWLEPVRLPGLPRGPSGRGWGVGSFPSDSVGFWLSPHHLVSGLFGGLPHLECTHGTQNFVSKMTCCNSETVSLAGTAVREWEWGRRALLLCCLAVHICCVDEALQVLTSFEFVAFMESSILPTSVVFLFHGIWQCSEK